MEQMTRVASTKKRPRRERATPVRRSEAPGIHRVASSGGRVVVRASTVRDEFAEYCNRVLYAGNRIVVARGRKHVAVLVSVDDLELLEKIEDRMDLEAARAALASAEKDGTVPWEKIKADLGLA